MRKTRRCSPSACCTFATPRISPSSTQSHMTLPSVTLIYSYRDGQLLPIFGHRCPLLASAQSGTEPNNNKDGKRRRRGQQRRCPRQQKTDNTQVTNSFNRHKVNSQTQLGGASSSPTSSSPSSLCSSSQSSSSALSSSMSSAPASSSSQASPCWWC